MLLGQIRSQSLIYTGSAFHLIQSNFHLRSKESLKRDFEGFYAENDQAMIQNWTTTETTSAS